MAAPARLLTRHFVLVFGITFVTFFAAFQLFPTAPLQLRRLGASLAESGRFMTVFTAGSSLGAAATAGVGPIYSVFAWIFGGQGTEPVRNLTQEYGATYIMVAGLLNWLCLIDIFDRSTGRWVWRLPKDEQEALLPKPADR